MENHRLWVICYDIRDEKRLRRVARVMERYGSRIQKSVFECWLMEPVLKELLNGVRKEMDVKVDSVRCYTLCKDCQEMCEERTDTKIQTVQQYYIV